MNSNASLFYIAFVKGHVPLLGEDTQCANGSCMQELAQQLGIIFATQVRPCQDEGRLDRGEGEGGACP